MMMMKLTEHEVPIQTRPMKMSLSAMTISKTTAKTTTKMSKMPKKKENESIRCPVVPMKTD
jgi:hypothetical protein